MNSQCVGKVSFISKIHLWWSLQVILLLEKISPIISAAVVLRFICLFLGSIRLVHKALTEAAASTARKRRGVMDRLGPQVDNSSLLGMSPDRNTNVLLQERSLPDVSPCL